MIQEKMKSRKKRKEQIYGGKTNFKRFFFFYPMKIRRKADFLKKKKADPEAKEMCKNSFRGSDQYVEAFSDCFIEFFKI